MGLRSDSNEITTLMKTVYSLLVITFASIALAADLGGGSLASIPAMSPSKSWKLVWSDEFNYKGVPDPSKWGYEVGFIRNKESQYYTEGRLENARVEDGHLVIEARKEDFKPEKGPAAAYTSASLITKNKASWKYGRIEVRAKLPQGKGIWAAIWMLPNSFSKDPDWPMCGEIDIMEFLGREPNRIYGTIHYGESAQLHKSDQGKYATPLLIDGYHVYAVEWNPDRIDYFFDDVKYHTVQLDQAWSGEKNAFREPFYLILNLAMGGSWGGEIDDPIFPQKYLIDYVRVYEADNADKTPSIAGNLKK